MRTSIPVSALTIAGSDSDGGAGIQANLKTFAAHRVHGRSAIAALTAQHIRGVIAVHATALEFLVTRGLQSGYQPGRGDIVVLDHFGAARPA